MKRIKQLNENVINQIAAGEVIERPASVIKELVENSIDAGANRIEVELSQGGRYLRVSDNGSGMHAEDIKLAFSRHCTSKITDEKDLWRLNTLGFRGEALASVVSISRLTCTSKTKEAENGTKLFNDDRGELQTTPIGCANGTTIEIKDLFYNVPARLKFLRKPTTEIAAIVETLQNIAISHPEVAFNCKNQNKIALKTSGSNDLSITLSEIYSKDLLNHLLIVNAIDEGEKYFVNGVVTEPSFTRSNRKSIYIIINGRIIKCPILSKAIERGFESVIPSGRFPLAVINVLMPADKIDVNVHPAKKEVRYTATNNIFAFINYAIKKALQDQDYYVKREVHIINQPQNAPIEQQKINKHNEIQKTVFNIKPEEPIKVDKNPLCLPDKPLKQTETIIKHSEVPKAIEFYKPIDEKFTAPDNKNIVNKPEEKIQQLTIKTGVEIKQPAKTKQWTIIGQALNTYIILETTDGLQIIDQHIADERAIYDRLKRQKKDIAAQRLLVFEEINITLDQLALLDEYSDQLEQWGYEFDKTENNTITIKQIPQVVTGKDQKAIFEEIISMLENGGSFEALEDNILKTISCHGAIKAGDPLSIKEMETIITNWNNSDYPYTCPHGRKIAHNISLKELAGYFDRQPSYI